MYTWICIENCGACCKFDINERPNIEEKLSDEDIALINSMISKDGWCKHLDKKNKNPHNYGASYLILIVLLCFIIFLRFLST